MNYHNPIVADNLNELVRKSCHYLINSGTKTESRNGDTYEVCDINLYLTNPQNRHLYLAGRQNNIYACLAEVIWVLAGTNALDPLMNFFLPRAKDFSDDGKTWANGYGAKLYRHGNLQNVFDAFLKDGVNTRRACCAIWTPQTDTYESLKAKGFERPKDQSCNNFLYFWIRDNQLHMKVCIRSNDVLWGMSAINVAEWTVLQELVLQVLRGADFYRFCDVKLGNYIHSVVSLHLYDQTAPQAKAILSPNNYGANSEACTTRSNFPIKLSGLIKDATGLGAFFNQVYQNLCRTISEPTDQHSVFEVFDKNQMPLEGNQLYHYCALVEAYILTKKLGADRITPVLPLLSDDLKVAIMRNHFTKKLLGEV